MRGKKIIILCLGFLMMNFSYSQQNIYVCYNEGTTVSIISGTNDSYQWQTKLINDSVWVTVKNWSEDTLVELNNLTSSLTVRCFIDENDDQLAEDTIHVANINVYGVFNSGLINLPQTICYNTIPTELSGANCNGGDGTYSYQWEQSTDGLTFSNAIGTGATTLNFTPNALTQTTVYRLKYTSGSNCGTVYSNEITITVYPDIIAATIGTSQTICYNTIPNSISIQNTATGGNGSFNNQWQIYNGGSWEDIIGETGDTCQLPNLTISNQYRVKSTSNYGCGVVNSNVITITVYDSINAGIIGHTETICYNTMPTEFLFTTNPSGEGGSYSYQWQSSEDNVNFTDISIATSSVYQSSELALTRYFRAIVTSIICGTSDTTNDMTISVHPEFLAGSISTPQTICYNTIPTELSGTNCNGGDGTYSYQWEQSTDGLTFSNAIGTGATTLNFTPNALTQTTVYRLKYTSGSNCGTVYSNEITITVYPDIIAATIGTSQTICYNTIPNSISIQSTATGGNGSFNNQWQMYNGGSWEDIIGETGDTCQLPNLTISNQYRVKSTSNYGCGVVNSNVITITVYDSINAGIIGHTETICYNTMPTEFLFTTNPSGEGGSYSYQWQSSEDNVNFTDISTATNNAYQCGNLITTTYFRAIVTSIICGTSDTTNDMTISVHPEFLAGSISTPQTICYNTIPTELSGTNCNGGDGTYSYQWEQSTDGLTFLNAIGMGATSLNYTPNALTQTTIYRLKYNSGSNCGTVYSNEITITVYPDIIAATIGTSQTICYNTIPNSISIQNTATGGNGSFNNQWQIYNGGSWEDIIGETGDTCQLPNLTISNQYRVKSTSNYGCGVVNSNVITITVYDSINAGIIGHTETICYNTMPTEFLFTTNPSGEGGSYSYQWQSSEDNVNFTDISTATNNTYQCGNLITTTYFRAIVTSDICGTSDVSNIITINVQPQFLAGTISTSQSICFNTIPAELVGTNCSGGDGSYSYHWEQSTDSVNFSNANGTGATTLNFTPNALTQTTVYRLKYTSGSNCGTVYSNEITITVYPDIIAATIGTSQTICYNTIPNSISIQSTATGGNGSFNNQWQMYNGGSWEDIIGETVDTCQLPNLTISNQYRVKSTSNYGCGVVNSNVITITVYDSINAGIIGHTETICYNTMPTEFLFTTNPSGEGGSYSYQWQSSEDNVNFTDISTATNNTYQCGNLITTTYFRAIVTSDICGTSDVSNIITINVQPQFLAGTISTSQSICFNTIPAELVGTNCLGGDGSYSYHWEQSTDSVNFSNANGTGATTLNFTPNALTQTTVYRLKYTSGSNCGTVYSNEITITVYPDIIAATIGTSQTICYNTIPNSISIQSTATGGNGSFNNQWQMYNGGSWEDIIGETVDTCQLPNLTISNQYRVKSTSNYGCGVVNSNVITITVYDSINAGIIGHTETICYNTMPTEFLFTTNPSGEGGSYSYQWQSSEDNVNFTDISTVTNNTYQCGNLITTTYFRAIVTSDICETSDVSNIITITILPEFITGEIAGNDTVCEYELPNELIMIQNCTGANGDYTYQWQHSIDGLFFSDIPNAINHNYQPLGLGNNSYFRLKFTSAFGCGVLYSNFITIIVIPNPSPRELLGDMIVCNNSYDKDYLFNEIDDNVIYQWSISGGVISEQSNNNHIIVNWNSEQGDGVITLYQLDTVFNCSFTKEYIIEKTENSAPEKSIIVRKASTNILIVCEDNDNIIYQWGFINRDSDEINYIPNSNKRYIMLPHDMNVLMYDYFVTTSYDYGSQLCNTTTFFEQSMSLMNCDNFNGNNVDNTNDLKIYPNPVREVLNIETKYDFCIISITDIMGKVVYKIEYTGQKFKIPISFASGTYLIHIKTDKEKIVAKFIVE